MALSVKVLFSQGVLIRVLYKLAVVDLCHTLTSPAFERSINHAPETFCRTNSLEQFPE